MPARPYGGSPEIAAGEHVDKRHERDETEDTPGQFRAATEVVPGCQVDPHEDDGDRVNETDKELEEFFHCPVIPAARRDSRRQGRCRPGVAAALAGEALLEQRDGFPKLQ